VSKEELNQKEISKKHVERGSGRYKMERMISYGIPEHSEDG
jgi:hypothetical protein